MPVLNVVLNYSKLIAFKFTELTLQLLKFIMIDLFYIIKHAIKQIYKTIITPAILFDEISLNRSTQKRLVNSKRKILVLDLDETLIHSSSYDNKTSNLGRHFVTQVRQQQSSRTAPLLVDSKQSESSYSSNGNLIKSTVNNISLELKQFTRLTFYTNKFRQILKYLFNLILKILFILFDRYDFLYRWLLQNKSKKYLPPDINSHRSHMSGKKSNPDFSIKLCLNNETINFTVKRPHVDYFLKTVSKWYDLVVFTASLELYGSTVCDMLEKQANIIFTKRYYRQDCISESLHNYTKDLSIISKDLGNVIIVDNSPSAYKYFPDNAIPIKSYFGEIDDLHLLGLLPILDCLRFCGDVRNILHRENKKKTRINKTGLG